MADAKFYISNKTFREIMGNGYIYIVPPFQRDYSWDIDQWSDLWEDMLEVYRASSDKNASHYMGYIVLQPQQNSIFHIIDGQQRLTTMSIFVLAIMSNIRRLIEGNIEVDHNKMRIEEIQRTYLGYMNPATLISTPKLTLNRNTKRYYEYYMLASRPLPRSGTKEAEMLLGNAFAYFDNRIKEQFQLGEPGKDIADFLEKIVTRLIFTIIEVNDQLNAFDFFETLNARGVHLSSTDLLKNYLFSVILQVDPHEKEIEILEDTWSSILSKLGEEKFSDFLRVYWNSQKPLVRPNKIYASIRKEIANDAYNSQKVFTLLSDLDQSSDLYVALIDPNNSFWTGKNNAAEIRELLQALEIFETRQPMPLLLATYRHIPEIFTRVLKLCVNISFRYNIIGNMQANKQEQLYNDVAIKIENKSITNISGVFNILKEIYPNDDQFRGAFVDKLIYTNTKRNKNIVRYILSQIEKYLSGFDIEQSRNHNIEHIFPQNPNAPWSDIRHTQRNHFLFRLGNLTLLESSLNYKMGNDTFDKKKVGYAQSALKINQRLAEFPEWDTSSILRRQAWLAEQAVKIWREELA
jgi:hypothetical protein